jgi:hypothetical protein
MMRFLSELQETTRKDFFSTPKYKLPLGGVFRFDGVFHNYTFTGIVQRAKLTLSTA